MNITSLPRLASVWRIAPPLTVSEAEARRGARHPRTGRSASGRSAALIPCAVPAQASAATSATGENIRTNQVHAADTRCEVSALRVPTKVGIPARSARQKSVPSGSLQGEDPGSDARATARAGCPRIGRRATVGFHNPALPGPRREGGFRLPARLGEFRRPSPCKRHLCRPRLTRTEGTDRTVQGRDYLRALTRTLCAEGAGVSGSGAHQARGRAVRARMAAVGSRPAPLVVTHPYPTSCYLTGYSTFAVGRHACLRPPGPGRAGAPGLGHGHPGRGHCTGWVEYVEPLRLERGRPHPERIAALVRLAQGLERARTGLGAGAPSQPPGLRRRAAPPARCDVRGTPPAWSWAVRLIKSAGRARLRAPGRPRRSTLAGVEASYQAIAPGRDRQRRGAGRYDAMVAAGSEFLSVDPIVTAGHRSRLGPHLLQAERPEGGRRGVPRIRRLLPAVHPAPSCGLP